MFEVVCYYPFLPFSFPSAVARLKLEWILHTPPVSSSTPIRSFCLPLDSLASLSSAPVSLVTSPSLPPCFLSLTGFHFLPVTSFPFFTPLVSFPFFLSPLSYLPLLFPQPAPTSPHGFINIC
ncbi:unnamed protein product [Rangifer tarandus platyrhynchus]|uniref:Uncharacterized protein n=2 Tax=Rangifer tarandus platyrhynchus TaxID=3082113 RepID=A0ABN8XXZ3_RANTA|nr:unnamed protein product [Rangifer tarandus platyrhynchus]